MKRNRIGFKRDQRQERDMGSLFNSHIPHGVERSHKWRHTQDNANLKIKNYPPVDFSKVKYDISNFS